ncbi:MAG: helix-turn-helix domain-containing protein [Rhizobiales bacterium]|nr:helix-turn-helix domain-containing protein [Hyphomicrobiales bacterium]
MNQDEKKIKRKLRVIKYAEQFCNISKTSRYFGVGRTSIYRWLLAYRKNGENGLINAKPIPINTAGQPLLGIVQFSSLDKVNLHGFKRFLTKIVWHGTTI